MDMRRICAAAILALLVAALVALQGCGSADVQTPPSAPVPNVSVVRSIASIATRRPHFLGAFFRPDGTPPYGVIDPQSSKVEPAPYPQARPSMPATAYCAHVAANGTSIAQSFRVDPTKLSDAIFLGVRWTRMGAPQFVDDYSHVFAGQYVFGELDAAQCASLVYHGLRPIIGLETGLVEYNAIPGTFSPTGYAHYQTAQDFGQWCGVVAAHENSAFGVNQFSSPGNEVNTMSPPFPGGEPALATYAMACYAAIKSANPNAFVYGFELNMDGGVNAPAFVARMYALGCKLGTCYDGIAMHLTLRYPQPAPGTPCFPNPGGDYTMACITDVQAAAQAPVHVLVSETEYTMPASVPDEATKALAVVSEFTAFAADRDIDGVNYADIDECAVYTGFWAGSCLISEAGTVLPAYGALQQLAGASFL
jgi:hypothetical protein